MDSKFFVVATFLIFTESVIFGLIFSFAYQYTKNILYELDKIENDLNKYKSIIEFITTPERVNSLLCKADLTSSLKDQIKKEISGCSSVKDYMSRTKDNIMSFIEATDLILYTVSIFWGITTIAAMGVIVFVLEYPCGTGFRGYFTIGIAIAILMSCGIITYSLFLKHKTLHYVSEKYKRVKMWLAIFQISLFVLFPISLFMCFWLQHGYIWILLGPPIIISFYLLRWFMIGDVYKPLTCLFLLRKMKKACKDLRTEEEGKTSNEK